MLLAPAARRSAARGRRAAARQSSSAPSAGRAERIEVAGPGFLNVFLSDRWHREAIAALLAAGDGLGPARSHEAGERILVEFVSANPTGPVTAASGRGAAYGDSLARMLAAAGTRSSASTTQRRRQPGRAVRRSIAARMAGRGAARGRLRGRLRRRVGRASWPPRASTRTTSRRWRGGRRGDARADRGDPGAVRVHFDTWSSERGCTSPARSSGRSRSCARAATSTSTTAPSGCGRPTFGDDKDRVLVRADGEPTYFAPDIAYHRDKLERGPSG